MPSSATAEARAAGVRAAGVRAAGLGLMGCLCSAGLPLGYRPTSLAFPPAASPVTLGMSVSPARH
ncbi:hypothetical protein ACFU53_23620 [Streptomyces sp. NPDC057474]|uniref:hypothetical protein n=1 Tax=Streptomyces sp. NPDC057474 TaxID=3346144 RepID=UPI0036A60E10